MTLTEIIELLERTRKELPTAKGDRAPEYTEWKSIVQALEHLVRSRTNKLLG